MTKDNSTFSFLYEKEKRKMKKAKPVRVSKTIMSHLMMPNDANSHGTVHGGTILKLVDIIAYVCSSRHAENPTVTASIDKVDFKEPVRIGELVILHASINYVGRTSMEVGVRVEAEDIIKCKKRHTSTCYLTTVSVDKRNRPKKVPRLIAETPEEIRREREAEKRREVRLMGIWKH